MLKFDHVGVTNVGTSSSPLGMCVGQVYVYEGISQILDSVGLFDERLQIQLLKVKYMNRG